MAFEVKAVVVPLPRRSFVLAMGLRAGSFAIDSPSAGTTPRGGATDAGNGSQLYLVLPNGPLDRNSAAALQGHASVERPGKSPKPLISSKP